VPLEQNPGPGVSVWDQLHVFLHDDC
jgi:hypothetical protein